MKQEFESTGPKNMDIVVETALKYNVTSILSGIVNVRTNQSSVSVSVSRQNRKNADREIQKDH